LTFFSGREDFLTATVRNPEFGIRNQPLVAAKGRAVSYRFAPNDGTLHYVGVQHQSSFKPFLVALCLGGDLHSRSHFEDGSLKIAN
jgi:hypothetical protein